MITPVPRRVFCFWLGGAPLTETRQRQLELLRRNVGVPVELVTDESLPRWVRPEAPLCPGWQGLTALHLSDYLRSYFMAHHGGGYSDVKAPGASWVDSFELIDRGDVDCVGYRLPGPSLVARFGLPPDRSADWIVRAAFYRHLRYRRLHDSLIGQSAFIFRPGSPIALEYLRTVEQIIGSRHERLPPSRVTMADGTRDPGYDVYRRKLADYPLTWGALCMDVLHPLSIRHRDRISLTLPAPAATDPGHYR